MRVSGVHSRPENLEVTPVRQVNARELQHVITPAGKRAGGSPESACQAKEIGTKHPRRNHRRKG